MSRVGVAFWLDKYGQTLNISMPVNLRLTNSRYHSIYNTFRNVNIQLRQIREYSGMLKHGAQYRYRSRIPKKRIYQLGVSVLCWSQPNDHAITLKLQPGVNWRLITTFGRINLVKLDLRIYKLGVTTIGWRTSWNNPKYRYDDFSCEVKEITTIINKYYVGKRRTLQDVVSLMFKLYP